MRPRQTIVTNVYAPPPPRKDSTEVLVALTAVLSLLSAALELLG